MDLTYAYESRILCGGSWDSNRIELNLVLLP
jgi:hypothetical protein